MIELLVVATCMGDYACDKSLKAYYYEKPHLRVVRKKVKRKVVYYTGEWVAYTVPAVMAAASRRGYEIKLTKKTSFKVGKSGVLLNYRFDY